MTAATPRATDDRVRRELVHRANEQEILVSPPWQEAAGGYGSSTVTTAVSPYYRDHPGPPLLDPLLLVEACRQAALSAAHEFEGLSSDIAFFFNSIEMEIPDPAALAGVGGELTITTRFEALRLRSDGSPKQIAYTQRCTDRAGSGPTLARTSMAVQGVPKDRYQELRAYQRSGSTPPTTAGLRSAMGRPAGLASPQVVARTLAANVVLADVRFEGEVARATLAPDLANTSLFDHDYDHFPAMVLIEAGRQLALSGTGWPTAHAVTAVRATFPQFAELDAETGIVATRVDDRVDVECLQNDLVVTRMTFRVAPFGAAEPGRWAA